MEKQTLLNKDKMIRFCQKNTMRKLSLLVLVLLLSLSSLAQSCLYSSDDFLIGIYSSRFSISTQDYIQAPYFCEHLRKIMTAKEPIESNIGTKVNMI